MVCPFVLSIYQTAVIGTVTLRDQWFLELCTPAVYLDT